LHPPMAARAVRGIEMERTRCFRKTMVDVTFSVSCHLFSLLPNQPRFEMNSVVVIDNSSQSRKCGTGGRGAGRTAGGAHPPARTEARPPLHPAQPDYDPAGLSKTAGDKR